MPKKNQPAVGGDPVRTLTVQVNNVSEGDLGIGSAALTGGSWIGQAPVPGNVISPPGTSFVNGASNIFTALGGTLQLAPASGGSITITWTWPHGMGVTTSATGNALVGLAVTSTVINTQTNNPTLQVYVNNSASFLRALKDSANH